MRRFEGGVRVRGDGFSRARQVGSHEQGRLVLHPGVSRIRHRGGRVSERASEQAGDQPWPQTNAPLGSNAMFVGVTTNLAVRCEKYGVHVSAIALQSSWLVESVPDIGQAQHTGEKMLKSKE